MLLRAIIVDDEELARKRLRKMLARHDAVLQVVDEASNGEEAIQKIEDHLPDAIFLDVQMPGLNGFEVVRRLRHKPFIIFATAYDEYALEAFEENSVDYLLKPIEQKRLDKAVEKLQRVCNAPRSDRNENIEDLLERLAASPLKRLQVRTGDKIFLFDVEDIAYFEAKEKYTFLHTTENKHLTDLTLTELEEKLDKENFVRIHRSTIVNVKFIREIVKWFGGKYKVRLKDKAQTELVVSRGYVDRIQKL
ncbi:MAG TPA: LytTR family DNA-binding domain-containing protein [Bacteroidota bacterium]|nr:LytTR family DNA-binding domain-containing protein [Bacteroidota bacterium]